MDAKGIKVRLRTYQKGLSLSLAKLQYRYTLTDHKSLNKTNFNVTKTVYEYVL